MGCRGPGSETGAGKPGNDKGRNAKADTRRSREIPAKAGIWCAVISAINQMPAFAGISVPCVCHS
jgi:hypothetical protein